MQEKFKSVLWSTLLYKEEQEYVETFWQEYGESIYNLDKRQKELGIGEKVFNLLRIGMKFVLLCP